MQIKLSKRGPAMWFLGNPKKITASLTIHSPGPIEVDFDKLEDGEQQKILNDLRFGMIESDVDYQELYGRWAKSRPAVPEDPGDTQKDMEAMARKRIQEKTEKFQKRKEEKEQKIRERCDHLVSQSERGLKAGLKGKQDPKLIKIMLQTERTDRSRKGVIRYLEKKLEQSLLSQEKEISKKVSKDAEKQIKDNLGKETLLVNVVESEQETVILSSEDLVTSAIGK